MIVGAYKRGQGYRPRENAPSGDGLSYEQRGGPEYGRAHSRRRRRRPLGLLARAEIALARLALAIRDGHQRSRVKGPAADPRLADPIAAIAFALTIDDPWNALEFLRAWTVGDLATLAEWPEFKGGRNDQEKAR